MYIIIIIYPPPKYVNKIKKQRELTISARLLFVSHVHVH